MAMAPEERQPIRAQGKLLTQCHKGDEATLKISELHPDGKSKFWPASQCTHMHTHSKNTFLKQPLIILNFSWKVGKYGYNTAKVTEWAKMKKTNWKSAVAAILFLRMRPKIFPDKIF